MIIIVLSPPRHFLERPFTSHLRTPHFVLTVFACAYASAKNQKALRAEHKRMIIF